MNRKKYLVLEDGTVFEGESVGADGDRIGELVFTTGMCGYIETLTDPSYDGQIVLQTFPMIGNYGIIPEDFEGDCHVSGYVVREACTSPCNFRMRETLPEFLKKNHVPAMAGVDTRQITQIIRERGVMNAILCDQLPTDLSAVKHFAVKDAVAHVTCPEKTVLSPEKTRFRVALLDYGAKKNIARELQKRGCEVTVFPARTPASEILSGAYDGVMLSNGPGDPGENQNEIREIEKLFGKTVLFGICLGHQLMALSQGARTEKMKYGHRGVNQPVRETSGHRTYMTSQNHGYAVRAESIRNGKISFVNANDESVEGISYENAHAFSVQFHPEASSGPHDTSFLFDRFCEMMEDKAHAAGSKN